jgi:hypothetical protein
MELTMEGCTRLIINIFHQAIKDAKVETFTDERGEVTGLIGRDAREFLVSDWARFLLESLGIDPDCVHLVGDLA